MIHSKTVFVVGAGASKEVKLPIGSELTKNIAAILGTKTDDYHGTTFDDIRIREAVRLLERNGTSVRHSESVEIANLIRSAMPLAPSIDNFLDTHAGNEILVQIGKMAIVASILESESKSSLFVDRSNGFNRVNFSALEGTWYLSLWHILSTNIKKESISTIFDNVSFIVFNYDRCIEQFLVEALKTYYELDDEQASELMEKLTIIHPYGTVGRLPQLHNGSGLHFGDASNPRRFVSQTANVRTFTEQLASGVDLTSLHHEINKAAKLVFLGFGYHQINMDLLTSKSRKSVMEVFATCVGMSDSDREVTRRKITQALLEESPGKPDATMDSRNQRMRNIPINLAKCRCYDLFQEYSQSIGA